MRAWIPALVLGAAACSGPAAPHIFTLTFTNTTSPGALVDSQDQPHDIAFAPAIVIAHSPDFVLFTEGEASPWSGFEAITEDGNNVGLIAALASEPSVRVTRAFAREDADYNELPLMPGQSVSVDIEAHDGDHLTWVSMYGQSNDVFVGTPSGGLPAFTDGEPLIGDVTDQIGLYDGGTEANEEPAVGEHQPGRQEGPNAGEDEDGVITAISGTDGAGFTYPAPAEMLSLSLSALEIVVEE